MNSIQFADSVKAAFLKRFPNGWIDIRKLALGGGFSIRAGLISDINDQISKIRDNDQLSVLMFCHDTPYNSDKELSSIVVEFESSHIKVLPVKQFMAMDSQKIPVRKMNNSPEKVIQSLEKYFDKVLVEVKIQALHNNIYGQDRIPAKYLP